MPSPVVAFLLFLSNYIRTSKKQVFTYKKYATSGPVHSNLFVPPATKFQPKEPPQKARNRDKAKLATKLHTVQRSP